MSKLPGEGEIEQITRRRVRHKCYDCGEPATLCHSYLLHGARTNPASKAYHKDDCTWCADTEEFTCSDCKKPIVEDMAWCSTFFADRTPHMFLYWEVTRTEKNV